MEHPFHDDDLRGTVPKSDPPGPGLQSTVGSSTDQDRLEIGTHFTQTKEELDEKIKSTEAERPSKPMAVKVGITSDSDQGDSPYQTARPILNNPELTLEEKQRKVQEAMAKGLVAWIPNRRRPQPEEDPKEFFIPDEDEEEILEPRTIEPPMISEPLLPELLPSEPLISEPLFSEPAVMEPSLRDSLKAAKPGALKVKAPKPEVGACKVQDYKKKKNKNRELTLEGEDEHMKERERHSRIGRGNNRRNRQVSSLSIRIRRSTNVSSSHSRSSGGRKSEAAVRVEHSTIRPSAAAPTASSITSTQDALKAVQNDSSLTAMERRQKVQEIMSGTFTETTAVHPASSRTSNHPSASKSSEKEKKSLAANPRHGAPNDRLGGPVLTDGAIAAPVARLRGKRRNFKALVQKNESEETKEDLDKVSKSTTVAKYMELETKVKITEYFGEVIFIEEGYKSDIANMVRLNGYARCKDSEKECTTELITYLKGSINQDDVDDIQRTNSWKRNIDDADYGQGGGTNLERSDQDDNQKDDIEPLRIRGGGANVHVYELRKPKESEIRVQPQFIDYTFDFHQSDVLSMTAIAFKEEIEKICEKNLRLDFPVKTQVLVFEGEELDDTKPLKKQGFKGGEIIYLKRSGNDIIDISLEPEQFMNSKTRGYVAKCLLKSFSESRQDLCTIKLNSFNFEVVCADDTEKEELHVKVLNFGFEVVEQTNDEICFLGIQNVSVKMVVRQGEEELRYKDTEINPNGIQIVTEDVIIKHHWDYGGRMGHEAINANFKRGGEEIRNRQEAVKVIQDQVWVPKGDDHAWILERVLWNPLPDGPLFKSFQRGDSNIRICPWNRLFQIWKNRRRNEKCYLTQCEAEKSESEIPVATFRYDAAQVNMAKEASLKLTVTMEVVAIQTRRKFKDIFNRNLRPEVYYVNAIGEYEVPNLSTSTLKSGATASQQCCVQ